MRLKILETGFSPIQKIPLTLMRWSGKRLPGPIAVMSYHRDLWGKYAAACFQEAMRKARCWTLGELELFVAFVSKLNHCAW